MGVKSGVSTRFKEVNSKMSSIHCFGHALNLAVSDFVKHMREMKDTFEFQQDHRVYKFQIAVCAVFHRAVDPAVAT